MSLVGKFRPFFYLEQINHSYSPSTNHYNSLASFTHNLLDNSARFLSFFSLSISSQASMKNLVLFRVSFCLNFFFHFLESLYWVTEHVSLLFPFLLVPEPWINKIILLFFRFSFCPPNLFFLLPSVTSLGNWTLTFIFYFIFSL